MDKRQETLPKFNVFEESKQIRIGWRLPGVRCITDFLYWAFEYGGRYELRLSVPAKFGQCEIVPTAGAIGEYSSGLFWGYDGLYRGGFANIHYLVHHGLDGLPIKYFDSLPRDVPLFDVIPSTGGFFRLSLGEWFDQINNPSIRLSAMAIQVKKSRGT